MTTRRVRVSVACEQAIAERFPTQRTADGVPGVLDFMVGPYAAAHFAFERGWDELPEAAGPAVRFAITTPTPVFGPVVFFAVLLSDGSVEIAGFDHDDDYWERIGHDPPA